MKVFKQLMGLLLALIIICGAFSAVPFAAEAEHTAVDPEDGTYAPGQVIVMFKDGAINTDTLPDKGGVASTGAGFGEGMRAVSSEDAALSSAGGTADILSYSLGEDFTLEDTLMFPDADKDDGGLAATGASYDAPVDNGLTVALVSSEKYDTKTMIEKLRRNRNIAAVEPNQYIRLTDHADYSLNDTYNSYLYNLNSPAARNTAGDSVDDRGADPGTALSLNASDAWKKLGNSDEEIVIAVVDTGVLDTHEDLQDKMWINPGNIGLEGRSGYNFLGNNTEYYDDDEGHGTHCAGVIAAAANNNKGVAGVTAGANVKIIALKILGAKAATTIYQAFGAYNYILTAKQRGVNIVASNNSWGREYYSTIYDELIDRMGEEGILTVIAAGNESYDLDHIRNNPPNSASDYTVVVGAANISGKPSSFTNYGKTSVDLFAAGVDILSTVSYESYFPSLYTGDQLDATTEYYGEFGADTEVAGNTVTPTKGARAGDSVKTFGSLKYVKKDCFNDPEFPIPDTAELQLSVVRDKHIVSDNPYRLKVTLHNARYGEEYYVYFPYEKNSLTTGDDNTRFSALLTTGECDSSQTMMIYAGDIYQDDNGDTVMANNGKICAPIKSSYIGDGVHITNRIEPESPYAGTRLLSSADAQGKQIGFGFRITTLEDGNDFWGQGVGRDFTFYLESIAISKPGIQLNIQDSYDIMCGTSMACPAVCGASALIAALCPKQESQTPAQYTQSLREKLFSCVRRNDALADLCSTGGYLDLSLLDTGVPAITNAVCDVDNETITLCGANLFDGTELTCRSLSTAGAAATALPDGMTTECSDDGRSMVILNAKALFSTYTELIATSADGKVGTGKFFLVKGQPKLELISNLNPDTDKDPQPSLITDASGSALFGYDSSTGRIAKFDGKYLYYLPNTDLSAALTEYLPETGVSKYHVLNNYEFSVFSSITPITDGDLVYGFITATDNKTDELSRWIGVLDLSDEDLHWEFRPCGAFPDEINYLTGSKPYAAAYKGRIYFFSGLDVSAPHTKAFSLDLTTLAWNTEPAPPCDVTHPTITVYDGKLYYMMGAVVDHEKSGEERLANDVYCFDGTSWEKVGTIPFIGRYSFDNVAIYHMESVAKAKNGIVFVNTSVDGGGNIFLYNTKTNTCEPLYYTTDDTIVDCYNEQSSCVATEDGIYFARKSGYGINVNYELYLLPADSGAYESLYSGSALLGDVDGDGSVTVADATCIRRMLASIPLPFEFDENVADVDRDGEVTIVDVTMIQRWLVELPAADGIGKPIG